MSVASLKKLVILIIVLLVLLSISNEVLSHGKKEALSLKKLEWSPRSSKTSSLSQKSSMYMCKLINACLLSFLIEDFAVLICLFMNSFGIPFPCTVDYAVKSH